MSGTYSNLVRLYELLIIQSHTKEQEKTKRSQTRIVKIGKSVCCLVCRGQDGLVKLRYEPDVNDTTSQDCLIENYIEMIFTCFNINIVDEESGGCICETCIGRLRDALDFKKQVESAQEMWMKNDVESDELDADISDGQKFTSEHEAKPKKAKQSAQQEMEIMPPRLKNNTNQCPVCGEYHFNSTTLRIHYMGHFHPSHMCTQCGKRFMTRKQLNQHSRTMHKKDFKEGCQVCGKSYQTTRALEEHVKKAHENVQEYPCEHCSESFSTLDERRKHNAKAHKEQGNVFPCNICDKTFYSLSGQRSHIKSFHFGIKQFACKECDYKCFTATILERHKTVHRVPSVGCSMCSRLFKTESAMLEHMKLHTDDKAHKCQYCGASFAQIKSLKSHLVKSHKVNKKDQET